MFVCSHSIVATTIECVCCREISAIILHLCETSTIACIINTDCMEVGGPTHPDIV